MPITDMQPAEKVWGNFGCIRINCRTLCVPYISESKKIAQNFFSMFQNRKKSWKNALKN